MDHEDDRSALRVAITVAGGYAIVGGLWILLSDRLVQSLTTTPQQVTAVQSLKGVGFVFLSSVAIFALVFRSISRHTATSTELDEAQQQVTRLHRILRHNLRNSCQVIAGNATLLAERADETTEPYLSTIREHNQRLISLSRKSIYLQDFLEADATERTTVDIAASVATRVQQQRDAHPGATITLDTPDQAVARAHHHIGVAVAELVENAIRHTDAASPSVWVTVRTEGDAVRVTVADDGPGIPPVERRVLHHETETPTEHSQGLGLWLVYLTVFYSGGRLRVDESRHGGSAVTMTLPVA